MDIQSVNFLRPEFAESSDTIFSFGDEETLFKDGAMVVLRSFRPGPRNDLGWAVV